MQFLVYEQEPIVLADIYETLQDAFDVVIRKAPPFDAVEEVRAAIRDASVIFASVTQADYDAHWRDILSADPERPVVLISSSTLIGFEPTMRRICLPRPFTSEGLVNAARRVLSDQP